MKILLENYTYPPKELQKLLPEEFVSIRKDGKQSANLVGYYHNFADNQTIIILPKIFAEKNLAFGNIPVTDFLQEDALELLKKQGKTKSERDFVYRFAFIFYLSLKEFRARNEQNEITESGNLRNIISNIENHEVSELDLIFSLLRFYQENKDLILFKQKMAEKQHFQKTNWAKTIRNQTPFLQGKMPIYLQTNEKQKTQDNENELFAIFFTLLDRFKKEYGLNISFEYANILRGNDFDNKALKTLKNIRNQYFQDKFKRLLLLLLAYFEKKTSGNAKEGKEEFILCRNYNIVFEDMIDKLLSDTNLPKGLKEQRDGKIVDHLFQYDSLFNPESIFYIGDSKYYKETTAYSDNSIYKQHTYAKNVIQYNINLFHQKLNDVRFRYRDELTEGYNITPNFFIEAYIDMQNLNDTKDNFQFDKEQKAKINYHFENRIFDRDTLIILNFKINFLFVINAYIEKNSLKIQQFKQNAISLIRANLVDYFNENYEFYEIFPNKSVETFVNEHFRLLIGKIYRTSNAPERLILGLKKGEIENENIKSMFSPLLQTYILNVG